LTTTGSCLKHFESLDRKYGISSKVRVSFIRNWFDEPQYVESMSALIRETANSLPPEEKGSVHLLYSAHSIPASYIEGGDPYLEQTRRSVELINSSLGNAFPSTLAFQSKVGPVKWQGPDTKNVLQELGRNGCRAVAAVPVSFVSDHIETLQEMDILYRDIAVKSGIKEFRRVPSPNVDPGFISALAHIVEKSVAG
jgi:ferrochelatase